MLPKFRHVTLDATGTLFRPRNCVASVYMDHFLAIMPPLIRPVSEDAVSIKAFGQAFKTHLAASPNFGMDGQSETAKPWWGRVIFDTFPADMQTHMKAHPEPATQLIDALYTYYACGDAWEVYPDVRPALDALHAENVSIGVISNFDNRLHSILRDLDLDSRVDFVLTSWDHRVMKPDPSIFHEAARRLHCRPADLLHVGDDVRNDYVGAVAAGCSASLLDRGSQACNTSTRVEHTVTSLLDILAKI
ncbi:hypothetical protein H310_06723 [Aphanomyces invadans]|uniref:Haloacid dehalogenase, type II n=1 Tax=Aphanomyces invadans TaxID=157072 RepID=A0A024U669_9STRA|nr:hypothetical protein H310_06723 [Aphanomyces invadans]ETW01108.1 hypothetical protein H310_06723 [Aphanomyces invadans]|eukprot:XP_008870106.1 hypothetical protein H310_06723 [Aphanomyces invadans]